MPGSANFQLLLDSPIGADLCAPSRETLRGLARPITLDRRKGLTVDRVYFIAAGHAKLVCGLHSGQEHITSFLSRGALVFGVTGADGDNGSLQLFALGSCSVLAFPADSFAEIVGANSQASRNLSELAQEQMLALQTHASRLATLTACERVAAFLSGWSKNGSNPQQDGARIYLPTTRAEIGDHLGLTIETTSRCISRLKSEGLLTCPARDEIVILDHRALANFAD